MDINADILRKMYVYRGFEDFTPESNGWIFGLFIKGRFRTLIVEGPYLKNPRRTRDLPIKHRNKLYGYSTAEDYIADGRILPFNEYKDTLREELIAFLRLHLEIYKDNEELVEAFITRSQVLAKLKGIE